MTNEGEHHAAADDIIGISGPRIRLRTIFVGIFLYHALRPNTKGFGCEGQRAKKMASIAPSPQVLEYCRQLSKSNGAAKTLNLRCLPLSATDLKFLPQNINSLWIGPGFESPVAQVLQSLPMEMEQLDLDLSASEVNEKDALFLMYALFERAVSLNALALRWQGYRGVYAIAQSIPTPAFRLQMLDFRGNHIGDEGVKVLCDAMHACRKSKGYCSVTQLILSWNEITDVGVLSLCQLLASPDFNLKHLDLSCNKGISDEGFSNICRALTSNRSLDRLSLFHCYGITNATVLRDLLIEENTADMGAASGTKGYNYSLAYVDLGATPARAQLAVMEQINFGLALNRAGRLRLRCQKDHFLWILRSNLADQDSIKHGDTASSSVQWWRPAHELVPQDDPLEDLSISFFLLRQTSAFWSSPLAIDGEPMACD